MTDDRGAISHRYPGDRAPLRSKDLPNPRTSLSRVSQVVLPKGLSVAVFNESLQVPHRRYGRQLASLQSQLLSHFRCAYRYAQQATSWGAAHRRLLPSQWGDLVPPSNESFTGLIQTIPRPGCVATLLRITRLVAIHMNLGNCFRSDRTGRRGF